MTELDQSTILARKYIEDMNDLSDNIWKDIVKELGRKYD